MSAPGISLPKKLRVLRPAARWLQHRKTPWLVTWSVTERCNFTCDHCGCWREPGAELTPAQALDYAHEMVALGVLGVSLCGGEVLLRRDLGAVIAVLAAGGVTIRITTNGRLVPTRIHELRPVSRLKISLDGPPDLHDRVRGPRAFAYLEAALEAARGAGIAVQLNSVLTRDLIARLDEHLETVRRLGARVTFQPPEVRHDSAAKGVAAIVPDAAAMRATIARLIAMKRADDPLLGNSLGTFEYMAAWPSLPPMDCNAGRRFCRVLSDGRVVACDRPYAPRAAPPRGTPLGFEQGVEALERAGQCVGCWRNNTIEINRTLNGAVDGLSAIRRWA